MPILRHRLLADTQNETPHDIDHLYRLLSKQTRSSRLDQNVPGTCVYLQPYLNTQEGKYACILNYGLIVGTFHFLFNDILVMCLSNTYCHHVPTPQFKSTNAWPEHRQRPGSAGSPEAELEARFRLDKEAEHSGRHSRASHCRSSKGAGQGAASWWRCWMLFLCSVAQVTISSISTRDV